MRFPHYATAIVISTTAISYSPPLPFLTSEGELKVAEGRTASHITSGILAMRSKDSGLAPPAPTLDCADCNQQTLVFYAGSFTASGASGVHASRLAYVKRPAGDTGGGMVFRLDITRAGWDKTPAQISAVADACRIVPTDAPDLKKVDQSMLLLERAGADADCNTAADNVATVIRLDAPPSDLGVNLPLLLEIPNPLQAQIILGNVLIGYLSFEDHGAGPVLVRRDTGLQQPVVLLTLEQASGANLVRVPPSRVFVTSAPPGDSVKLYRVETNGTLSGSLYSFTEFNANNPLDGGLRDGSFLYLSDGNKMVRVPLTATTEKGVVLTTLDPALHIGRRFLDNTTRRIVFEAEDDIFSTRGGIFSVAMNAVNAAAAVLTHIPDSEGGTAKVELVANGRAFINVANHYGTHDALLVRTNGTGLKRVVHAYWAGRTRAASYSMATTVIPSAYAFYATRQLENGDPADPGTDTLYVINPSTVAIQRVLGTLPGTMRYQAITVSGIGRYALARVKMDRFGVIDNDVYTLDAATRNSLTPVADTPAEEIPLL